MRTQWNRFCGLWTAVCVGVMALALGGCRPLDRCEVLERGMVEHTLVMYLNANNNLSAHISNNAYDAERGMEGAMPSTRLIIYLDNLTSTTLYEIFYLQYGSANYVKHARVLKEYPEQTSTTPEVMKAVFEDIKRLVPSKSYGLVHAGHGSGWFPKPNSGTAYNNQKNKPLGPINSPQTSLTHTRRQRQEWWRKASLAPAQAASPAQTPPSRQHMHPLQLLVLLLQLGLHLAQPILDAALSLSRLSAKNSISSSPNDPVLTARGL